MSTIHKINLRCWRPIAKSIKRIETPFGSVDPFAMINCCAICKWIICSTNSGLPESVSAPPLNILMISKQVMRSSRLWHDQNGPLSRSWLKSNGITCQLTLSCHFFKDNSPMYLHWTFLFPCCGRDLSRLLRRDQILRAAGWIFNGLNSIGSAEHARTCTLIMHSPLFHYENACLWCTKIYHFVLMIERTVRW